MSNISAEEGLKNITMLFPLPGTIVLGILSTIVSLSTVTGNLLVITAFFVERALRNPTNYFIFSLAVTDLLIGLFSMNFYTLYLLLGYWPLGEMFCDLWLSLDYTACLTSQYTVFFITVDRFCSVHIPAKYRNWRTDNKVLVMVAATWIIPSVIFFTCILGWPTFTGKRGCPKYQCYAGFNESKWFVTTLTIGYFWITLCVMSGLYGGIYHVALNLQKKSDAKRRKMVSLMSMAGQTMSRIGVGVNNNEENNDGNEEHMFIGGKKSDNLPDKEYDGTDPANSQNNNFKTSKKMQKQFDKKLKKSKEKANEERCSSPTFPSDSDIVSLDTSQQVCSVKMALTATVNLSGVNSGNPVNIESPIIRDDSPTPSEKSPFNFFQFGNMSGVSNSTSARFAATNQKRNKQQQQQHQQHQQLSQQQTPQQVQNQLQQQQLQQQNTTATTIAISTIATFVQTSSTQPVVLPVSYAYSNDSDYHTASGMSNECAVELTGTAGSTVRSPNCDNVRSSSNSRNCGLQYIDSSSFNNSQTKKFPFSFTNAINQRDREYSLSISPDCCNNQDDDDEEDDNSPIWIRRKFSYDDQYCCSSSDNDMDEEDDDDDDDDVDDDEERECGYRHEKDPCTMYVSTNSTGNAVKFSVNGANTKSSMRQDELRNASSPLSKSRFSTGSCNIDLRIHFETIRERVNLRNLLDMPRDAARSFYYCMARKFRANQSREPKEKINRGRTENRARKALKTITFILGAFVICWTPYHTFILINVYHPQVMNKHLFNLSYWLCYINSPINPFCYALANIQFKKTFLRLLRLDFHRT